MINIIAVVSWTVLSACLCVCERDCFKHVVNQSEKKHWQKSSFVFFFFTRTSTEEMSPFTGGLPRFHFELNQNFFYCTNYWNLEYLN